MKCQLKKSILWTSTSSGLGCKSWCIWKAYREMECSCSCSGICTESFRLEKNLKTIRPWPLPQQCQIHYFTSLSLFSWNSSHLPQCIRNLGIISLSQIIDKLLPTSWTTEGVSLSSWVAGMFGWSSEAGQTHGRQQEMFLESTVWRVH